MHFSDALPSPPHFDIEVVVDDARKEDGFLRSVSRTIRTVSECGQRGADFIYDEIEREALDAVVIVPHFLRELGDETVRWVVLRSAVRPPVVLRSADQSPLREPRNRALWEVPAGLVERGERSSRGLRECAARELHEEAGFRVSPDLIRRLGPSSFPAPGMIAERHFYFEVEVDPGAQVEPSLDGSPLEEVGELVAVPLSSALASARSGELADAKTEMALRRLADLLEGSA